LIDRQRTVATGTSSKAVLTQASKLTPAIPRNRADRFDAKPIAEYQRHFPGFGDKVVSMSAGTSKSCKHRRIA